MHSLEAEKFEREFFNKLREQQLKAFEGLKNHRETYPYKPVNMNGFKIWFERETADEVQGELDLVLTTARLMGYSIAYKNNDTMGYSSCGHRFFNKDVVIDVFFNCEQGRYTKCDIRTYGLEKRGIENIKEDFTDNVMELFEYWKKAL
jgi:hypothetical protein